jgi:hypothetical protein
LIPAFLFQAQRPQPSPRTPIISSKTRNFHTPFYGAKSLTFIAQLSVIRIPKCTPKTRPTTQHLSFSRLFSKGRGRPNFLAFRLP